MSTNFRFEVIGEFIYDCGEYWMHDYYSSSPYLGHWFHVAGEFQYDF